MKIYLDNAATTVPDPRVIKAMDAFLGKRVGNASSLHSVGFQAAVAVEQAREIIAGRIHARPEEIYFTSGGTESNNWAIKGIAFTRGRKKGHIIVSEIEHPSVLEPVRWLEKQGFRVSYVGVDREGIVSVGDVRKAMTAKTFLVSIMHANNEIGTLQPVSEIGRLCREERVFFHTDACQSFTKENIDVRCDSLDLVTLSSHKIHGPRGVGVLYIRGGVKIEPMMHGGKQEYGKRAGTYNTEAIVGFSKAVEIASVGDAVKVARLRDYFIGKIEAKIEDVVLYGSRHKRLCHIVNFAFKDVEGKPLAALLNKKGIFISTGSACSANSLEPSHVVLALQMSAASAHGAVRISLSKWTTKKEIDRAVASFQRTVDHLRKLKR